MSSDFVISKCTRKCAVSGRPLEPGESYVSALVPAGDEIVRIDVAASEWTGPKPDTVGWWRCRMPDAKEKKLRPAPNGVLLDTLSDLLERPGKEALAYMLALLLTRRRVLTNFESIVEQTVVDDSLWTLTCPADGRQWNIPIVEPDAEQLQALQEELNSLLFTEE